VSFRQEILFISLSSKEKLLQASHVLLKPSLQYLSKILAFSFIFALIAGFLNPLPAKATVSSASSEAAPVNLTVTKSNAFVGDTKTPTITVKRKTGTAFPSIPSGDYYYAHLYNVDTGEYISSEEITSGNTVTMNFPRFIQEGINHYQVLLSHEVYMNPEPILNIQNFTNVIGKSDVFDYERKPFTLSLESISPTVDYAWLNWKMNQEINGEDYLVHVFDIDTGELVAVSGAKEDGQGSINFNFGESHNYQAFLTRRTLIRENEYVNIGNYAEMTDTAVSSNVFSLVRSGWQVSIQASSDNAHNLQVDTVEGGGEYATYLVRNDTREIIWDSVDPNGDIYWNITNPTASSDLKGFTAYVARSWKQKHGDVIFSDQPTKYSDLEDIIADSNGLVAQTPGISNPKQIAGGKNPNEPCSQSCHGDPINTATGEFFDHKIDIETIGNGLTPSVERSFSTINKDALTLLGYGWRTNYEMKIIPDSSNEGYDPNILTSKLLWLENENSSITSFYRKEDGSFSSASKTNATLRFDETSHTFILTRYKKEIYIFNSAGKLIKIQNDRNQTLNLTYQNGRLASISDLVGNTLTFAYNTNNLISTVTAQNGRVTTYTYNTAKQLTKVVNGKGIVYNYTYDTSRRVKTLSNELGGITTNTYNTSHQVTQQKDPLGRIITFLYSGDVNEGTTQVKYPNAKVIEETYRRGQLVQKVENYGKTNALTWKYAYNSRNELISVVNPDLSNSTMLYDIKGNMVNSIDGNGNSTTFTYDAQDNLLTSKDPYGNVTTNVYDENDNLVSSTTPLGKKTTFTYNADKSLASSTDARGNIGSTNPVDYTSAYTYLSNGLVSKLTNSLDDDTSMTYNSYGDMTSTKDGRGNKTDMEYNILGLLTKVTDPLQNETAMTYDQMGNVLTSKNAYDAVTAYTYDLVGNKITATNALNETITYSYNSMNQPVTITRADGTVQTITYDIFGRAIELKDELLRVTKQEWDANSRLKASINPDGGRTEYSYDNSGNVKTVKTPKGAITRFNYDKMNRLVKTIDALGRSSSTEYDADERISRTIAADGSVEENMYDAVGNVTITKNKAGNSKTYAYDSLNRKVSYTNELGQITNYSYDENSNLVSQIRPDASVVTYSYEVRNLLTSIDYPGTTEDITYTYDNLGRKVSEKKGATPAVIYTYDSLNRVLTRGATGNTVSYGYDNVGNLVSLTYPSGRVVSYDYDDAAQMTQLNTSDVGVTIFGYNNRGLLASSSYGNEIVESKGYDNDNQLTSTELTKNGASIYKRTQSYNTVGDVTQRGTATNGAALTLENFTYDPLSRLTEHESDATGQPLNSYGYNAVGNLSLLGSKVQTYDAAGKLTVTDSTTVSYDARNNRASLLDSVDSTKNAEYEWAQNNLLSSVTSHKEDNPEKVSYTYSADLLLQSRTVGAVTNEFVWDTSREIPVILSDGRYEYIYSKDRIPMAQVEILTGTVTYLHHDLTGSITASTDGNGALAGTVDYSPYGVATGALLSNFGYAGEWVDDVTGYSYLRARWLDSNTGIFLSEDSLVQMTNNAFGYTEGNPITQIDPLGLFILPKPGLLFKAANSLTDWFKDDDNVQLVSDISTNLSVLSTGLALLSLVPTPLSPVLAAASTVVGVTSLTLGVTATVATCLNHGVNDSCKWSAATSIVSALPIIGPLKKPIAYMGKYASRKIPKHLDVVETGRVNQLKLNSKFGWGTVQSTGLATDLTGRYVMSKC
jgi:RHS repeat-associated protein